MLIFWKEINQMFRCLCIERGYGRGTYFLVKDNRYGDRRLRGRLPEYDKPAGSYRRRYRHGLPRERLRKRYGVYHAWPADCRGTWSVKC